MRSSAFKVRRYQDCRCHRESTRGTAEMFHALLRRQTVNARQILLIDQHRIYSVISCANLTIDVCAMI